MRSAIKMDQECLACVQELLWELATELDLLYDEEDFFALADTLGKMKKAADLLESRSVELPDGVREIMSRIQTSLH